MVSMKFKTLNFMQDKLSFSSVHKDLISSTIPSIDVGLLRLAGLDRTSSDEIANKATHNTNLQDAILTNN